MDLSMVFESMGRLKGKVKYDRIIFYKLKDSESGFIRSVCVYT